MKAMTVMVVLLIGALCLGSNVLAGNLVIKGSTTVLPIAQKLTEAYMKDNPSVTISLSGGGSGDGIKAIIDGTTDIANSSRFIKEAEIKDAVAKGAYPVPFCIAYDCIVPVVNPANTVKDLTLAQMKDIYMGKVTNWKQLGGADGKVVVISRDTSSGTYEVWEEKVMQKERVFPGALLQASNGAIVQAISKNKYAIGYVGLGYVDKSVKQLPVGSIMGSLKTALDGTYPISRALFMFTRGWPTGATYDFITFTQNPEKGQKLVKEAGFIPLY